MPTRDGGICDTGKVFEQEVYNNANHLPFLEERKRE